MSIERVITQIGSRKDGIATFLDEEAPFTAVDQHHLEEHSPARAYWHHGYCSALADVLELLKNEAASPDSRDTSDPSAPAD